MPKLMIANITTNKLAMLIAMLIGATLASQQRQLVLSLLVVATLLLLLLLLILITKLPVLSLSNTAYNYRSAGSCNNQVKQANCTAKDSFSATNSDMAQPNDDCHLHAPCILKQEALDEMASTTVVHFTWKLSDLNELGQMQNFESDAFTDPSVPGAEWRICVNYDAVNQRLLVSLRAVRLSLSDSGSARMFLEVNCFCGGSMKATMTAMYPGMSEPLLWLTSDSLIELLAADQVVPINCILIIYNSITLHSITSLPPLSSADAADQLTVATYLRVNWTVNNWDTCTWEPGLAIFSPLFSLQSLPHFIWQLHVYPKSDSIEFSGGMSFFLKLVDCPIDDSLLPIEADMHLTINDEEFFDTVEFSRGSTHGFRDANLSWYISSNQLLVQCELAIKTGV